MSATLADELSRLRAEEAEAWERVKSAMAAVRQGDRVDSLIEPWLVERPDRGTSTEDLRRFTEGLIAAVVNRGLVFELEIKRRRAEDAGTLLAEIEDVRRWSA